MVGGDLMEVLAEPDRGRWFARALWANARWCCVLLLLTVSPGCCVGDANHHDDVLLELGRCEAHE